jgi:hypothetical protein
MDSLMDVDGPEFILEVNEAIAAVRLKKTGETYETFSHNSSVACKKRFKTFAVHAHLV